MNVFFRGQTSEWTALFVSKCRVCIYPQSPNRLKLLDWQDRVEAATSKLGAMFLDYRPETGTWVFTVSTDTCQTKPKSVTTQMKALDVSVLPNGNVFVTAEESSFSCISLKKNKKTWR